MSGFDGSAFALGVAVSAGAVLGVLAAAFAVAVRQRRHSVVDVAWGLGLAVVAVVSWAVSAGDGDAGRRGLVTVLVALWGLRLATHIARRNAGHGEDPRYEAMLAAAPAGRRNAYALRKVYLVQGPILLFVSLPVQAAQYGSAGLFSSAGVGVLTVLGCLLWAVGLFFEAVGDRQLARFKADPANRGSIMDRGLWSYTRHPNYFGDACVWWGVYLLAAGTGAGAATVLSPVLMTFLLAKGTGAALTESRMTGRPGFAEYVARTSGFLPRPPRRPGGAARRSG
jgi:steroid 5-alpha reductase family enzyme